MQCPDCDAVKIFSDPPEGNGKCSVCHGSGFGEFFDTAIVEFFNGTESPACEECNGSGHCQTCMGTGVIEEPEIKIAA
jgi:DnaJ-class molecular chaperone